ncbi:MAG: hypothetical protein KF753_00065 [Caldilineaceae bacterium]|nr:hypothetical protein [Caldilineaceae bacterium]
MPSHLSTGQRLLLQKKIHVDADAYAQSSRAVQRRFPSGWSAAIETARVLGSLPEEALLWWAEQHDGHLRLTANGDGYADFCVVNGEELVGVADLPMDWLLAEPLQTLASCLRPLDHLLGCGCGTGGWLSDGGGITPRWQQVGRQIVHLFSLGYGRTEASRADPHIYLAQGLALAITNRRTLNAADPKLERLLGASLLSPGFWRNFRTGDAG